MVKKLKRDELAKTNNKIKNLQGRKKKKFFVKKYR